MMAMHVVDDDPTPFDDLILEGGDAATLYGNDGVSSPTPIQIVVTNTSFVHMFGSARGNITKAHVASTVSVQAGQVITIPTQKPAWYLIFKDLTISRHFLFNPGTTMGLLALPYVLPTGRARLIAPTGVAPAPATALNWNDEPYTVPVTIPVGTTPTPGATYVVGEQAGTFRAGLMTDYDALVNQPEGTEPTGITVLYASLGADVRKDDGVTLPDGTIGIVQQLNLMAADGVAFARQVIVDATSTILGAVPTQIGG